MNPETFYRSTAPSCYDTLLDEYVMLKKQNHRLLRQQAKNVARIKSLETITSTENVADLVQEMYDENLALQTELSLLKAANQESAQILKRLLTSLGVAPRSNNIMALAATLADTIHE